MQKNAVLLGILLILPLATCACAAKDAVLPDAADETETRLQIIQETNYIDGDYRGAYSDGGIEQLSVEFTLRDGLFESIRLNSVNYRDGNYLDADATRIQQQVASQYAEGADYLIGKPVSAVSDLMDATAVTSDRDAVTSATLRTGKLLSAVNDGLRRGAFRPDDPQALVLPETVPDGVYRGAYYDSTLEIASVEFTLENGCFTAVSIRTSDGVSPAAVIRETAAEALLNGRPLVALGALYGEKQAAPAGQNVSGGMLVSAFMDALSRGIFLPTAMTVYPQLSGYASGVYRGFFCMDGGECISIQFEVVNDTFGTVRFRGLNIGGDCLAEEAGEQQKATAAQFSELANYLSGREVSRVYDLFEPAGIVLDADGSPAEELPAQYLVSAIMDGFARGVYRPLEVE